MHSMEECPIYSLKQYREEVCRCLSLLAAPAEEQIAYLEDSEVCGHVDELALEFHEVAILVDARFPEGQISEAEKIALRELDSMLASFGGSSNADYWTVAALSSSQKWREVRTAAADRLELFRAALAGR